MIFHSPNGRTINARRKYQYDAQNQVITSLNVQNSKSGSEAQTIKIRRKSRGLEAIGKGWNS